MHNLDPEVAAAEYTYRRDRIADDFRRAAASSRAVRWHLHRRAKRHRGC